jgi:hypothetical protein
MRKHQSRWPCTYNSNLRSNQRIASFLRVSCAIAACTACNAFSFRRELFFRQGLLAVFADSITAQIQDGVSLQQFERE